ncbi:hypothetical protein SVIOM74S_02724 [Streptomyces violarus]
MTGGTAARAGLNDRVALVHAPVVSGHELSPQGVFRETGEHPGVVGEMGQDMPARPAGKGGRRTDLLVVERADEACQHTVGLDHLGHRSSHGCLSYTSEAGFTTSGA